LRLERVNAVDQRKLPALRDVTLDVRRGEIMGVAGVSGNGQRPLAQVITGLRALTSGSITLDATGDQRACHPRIASALGVAYIPEERMHDGVVKDFTVAENAILRTYTRPPLARGIFFNFGGIARRANELVKSFQVKTPTIATPIKKPVGRQRAEADHGARAFAAAARDRRRPADARRRRGRQRVHSPALARAARRRRRHRCSSPKTSTKSSHFPTAFWSSLRGASWVTCPAPRRQRRSWGC
jgi:ABC-type dipeptide/oligopeptide/nickel transport system ATPase component